jgi:hypothetical protein
MRASTKAAAEAATPYFSPALLDASNAALARSDEAAIDKLIAQFGCKSGIFYDVGSNVGLQIRKLYEPELYHNNRAEPTFLEYFGPAPRCSVCTIALEPNPRHIGRLTRLAANYQAAGIGVLFLPLAASDVDGHMDFYVDVTPGKQNSIDLGASASPLKAIHQLAQYGEPSNATRVRTADLSRLIMHTHRELARRKASAPFKVVMKLDTEFLEFRILPHLTWTLALCVAIDAVMVDWSNLAVLQSSRRQPAFTQPAVRLADAMRAAFAEAYAAPHRGRKCRAALLDVDDETYMTGGHKFPMAPSTFACARRVPGVVLPRMGYCAFTSSVLKALRPRDCDLASAAAEAKGAVRSQTFSECVRHCERRCAACNYISFSAKNEECGWFRTCPWEKLLLRDGTSFRTVPVSTNASLPR